MYNRGDQGRAEERSRDRRNEKDGEDRRKDYDYEYDREPRRRRSRERKRSRSRSRSSSSDSGSRRRHRHSHRRHKGRHSSSSSSSSSSDRRERSNLKMTSNPTSEPTAGPADLNRSYEQYNYHYQPPRDIFEERELAFRYSSGINMEAPPKNDGFSGLRSTTPSTGNDESQSYSREENRGPAPGGISMKLQVHPKDSPGLSAPRAITPVSAKIAPAKPGSIFSKPKLFTPAGSTLPSKSLKVASVFNVDDDDEPEEMPPECKMRMKNVGRDTPTSAGPNSFGKTKIGFCNVSHITEKNLEGSLAGGITKKK